MTTVSALELKGLLEARPHMVLLNVRPAGMQSQGQIAGSLHIPLSALKEGATTLLPDKGAWIAVYGMDLTCETSTRAAKILEGLGYSHIYNFSAGLKGWKDAGFLAPGA